MSGNLVEFIRFGSSIPGAYWGCCACDIIQCFKSDPDAKASIQMVDGDGCMPCGDRFAGPTNRDVFNARIRVGTFGISDMPNHAFIAILTQWQIESTIGKKWLAILKETGFEFVRSVSNSVYAGDQLAKHDRDGKGSDVNHIFMLVRNIGAGNLGDPYMPPKAWTDLPKVVPEAWEYFYADYSGEADPMADVARDSHKAQTEIWNKIGPAKFLTEKQVEEAGAPVIYAAKRTNIPQETKSARNQRNGQKPATKSIKDMVAA